MSTATIPRRSTAPQTMTAGPRDPDETIDIQDLAREVVAEPEVWLDAPHPMLGLERPRDLIGTEREIVLRNLLRAAKHGMPT